MASTSSPEMISVGGKRRRLLRRGSWATAFAAWPASARRPSRRRRWVGEVSREASVITCPSKLTIRGQIGIGGDLFHQPFLEALDLGLESVFRLAGELPAMAMRHEQREWLHEPAHADFVGGEGTNRHSEPPALDGRLLRQDIAVESEPI